MPGLATEAKQPKPAQKKVQQKKPKKKKMRTKRLVIVSLGVLLFLSLIGLSIVGLANYLLSEDDEQTESAKADVFVLTPDQIVDIYNGDTFKVDQPSQHPLFGADLSIRVFGIDTPEMKGTSDEVKALAMQAREVTEKALKRAERIELRNPQRGKYFRLIAEVWIDGESLADTLKAKGLTKDYDGEGARPEW